jgi:CubicO group peptidase (beta-lactamase class C family)
MRAITVAAAVAVVLTAVFTGVEAAQPPRIDPAALQRLIAGGKASHSSALLVWQKGHFVTEQYYGTPPHPGMMMSVTKSVVALAVGKLVDAGKLGFDQPVSDFFPEWKQGQKRKITIRHLLTHTSGLQNEPNTTVEIYPAPDGIKLALAAELSNPPGTVFSYNNKAMNLLAAIVEAAAGKPMDRYIIEDVLKPIGINAAWEPQDRDKAGHPYAMSGLLMTGADLVKVGRLVLGNGAVDGKRVLAEKTMQAIVAQGSPLYPGYGLLWWRIPKWKTSTVTAARLDAMKSAGVDASFITAMTALRDRPLRSQADVYAALQQTLGDKWVDAYQAARAKTKVFDDAWSPDIVGVAGNGYLGQYLVVLPAADLVAVRLVDGSDKYDDKTDGMEDFETLVRALVEPQATH